MQVLLPILLFGAIFGAVGYNLFKAYATGVISFKEMAISRRRSPGTFWVITSLVAVLFSMPLLALALGDGPVVAVAAYAAFVGAICLAIKLGGAPGPG
jgi:hypothetical protein